jgi:hypothetical protein
VAHRQWPRTHALSHRARDLSPQPAPLRSVAPSAALAGFACSRVPTTLPTHHPLAVDPLSCQARLLNARWPLASARRYSCLPLTVPRLWTATTVPCHASWSRSIRTMVTTCPHASQADTTTLAQPASPSPAALMRPISRHGGARPRPHAKPPRPAMPFHPRSRAYLRICQMSASPPSPAAFLHQR